MASYQTVVDPRTQQASGYYFNNGQYFKTDAKGQFVPAEAPDFKSQPLSQSLGGSQSSFGGLDIGADQTGAGDLFKKTYGTNPQDYSGTFNQAYQNLNQPGGNDAVSANGVFSLAKAFIDRVHQKSGKLPSEEDIRGFVAQNLNTPFASKFIQGLNNDQIMSNYVDPYIQTNPNVLGQQTGPGGDLNAVGTIQNLSSQLPSLYKNANDQLGEVADTAFAAPRKAAIEDEAALGRLRSPASIENIGKVDAAKATSLAGARSNLLSQQIGSTTDIGKALAGVQQAQQGINNQANQFQQTNNLNRMSLNDQMYDRDVQRGYNQQALNLSSMLGKQQAEANEPGWMDYLNTGLTGLSAIGGIPLGGAGAGAATTLLGKLLGGKK